MISVLLSWTFKTSITPTANWRPLKNRRLSETAMLLSWHWNEKLSSSLTIKIDDPFLHLHRENTEFVLLCVSCTLWVKMNAQWEGRICSHVSSPTLLMSSGVGENAQLSYGNKINYSKKQPILILRVLLAGNVNQSMGLYNIQRTFKYHVVEWRQDTVQTRQIKRVAEVKELKFNSERYCAHYFNQRD